MMVVVESVAASPSFPQERIGHSQDASTKLAFSSGGIGDISGDVGRVHLDKSVRTEWKALAEI